MADSTQKKFPKLFVEHFESGSLLYDDTMLNRHVAKATSGLNVDDEVAYFNRLAAAWNATASISTADLEVGVVG